MSAWLSIIGGGLVSVLITIGFNVYWDLKKQHLLEDWEFRRYHANQIQLATAGLMEAFFAAKAELYFLFLHAGNSRGHSNGVDVAGRCNRAATRGPRPYRD